MGSVGDILRLYLVTGIPQGGLDPLLDLAERAIQGGVTVIQLREKEEETRKIVQCARALKDLLKTRGVPLVINDRADIARVAGADGLHLGQEDLPVCEAREIVGAKLFIGLSTHNEEQATGAQHSGADYIGVGPVFQTATKENPEPVIGVEVLRRIVEHSVLPCVAIGGITEENIDSVIQASPAGIAVSAAIAVADDPQKAARELSVKLGALERTD